MGEQISGYLHPQNVLRRQIDRVLNRGKAQLPSPSISEIWDYDSPGIDAYPEGQGTEIELFVAPKREPIPQIRVDRGEPYQVVADWQESLTGEMPTVYDMFDQVYQEGHEVAKVVAGMTPDEINNLPETAKDELAGEAMDNAIASMGLIAALKRDYNGLFYSKLAVMLEKYPVELIREIMRVKGVGRREALTEAKSMYQKRNGERE